VFPVRYDWTFTYYLEEIQSLKGQACDYVPSVFSEGANK
jgi:hypothetical protein